MVLLEELFSTRTGNPHAISKSLNLNRFRLLNDSRYVSTRLVFGDI